MIFTSSSVTSFQDYRLQEKSIQNTSLASGLCSGRMLTSPPRISGSWLSWSGNRTQTIRSKEKRKKKQRGKPFQWCAGSWIRSHIQLTYQSGVWSSSQPLTLVPVWHLTEFTKRRFLTSKMIFFSDTNTIFIYYLFASNSWDSRYHSTRLVDLRKWAPLFGEISWEKKKSYYFPKRLLHLLPRISFWRKH